MVINMFYMHVFTQSPMQQHHKAYIVVKKEANNIALPRQIANDLK